MIAVENDAFTTALEVYGKQLPKPRAVIVVSAHWESPEPIRINAVEHPELIYDFGGFPDELFNKKYPCPGDPVLASEILRVLSRADIPAELEMQRGLDHGVWTPLCRLFPKADVPVVEVSLPVARQPRDVLNLGKALAAFRSKNVLLIGTGGIVHNLRRLQFGVKEAPVDDWAKNFDSWVAGCLEKNDIDSLLDYRRLNPNYALAVQGPEHFDPLFFALGASSGKKVTPIYEGFHYGNLSMRSVQFD